MNTGLDYPRSFGMKSPMTMMCFIQVCFDRNCGVCGCVAWMTQPMWGNIKKRWCKTCKRNKLLEVSTMCTR